MNVCQKCDNLFGTIPRSFLGEIEFALKHQPYNDNEKCVHCIMFDLTTSDKWGKITWFYDHPTYKRTLEFSHEGCTDDKHSCKMIETRANWAINGSIVRSYWEWWKNQ